MYSLESIEDFFGPRTTQKVCRSFAAVERSISDRLLATTNPRTSCDAATSKPQSHDLGECQREGRDQSGAWRNGTSFGLNDLEGLVTVARDAKEWIAAHVLKQ